jgi:hypothetical protein
MKKFLLSIAAVACFTGYAMADTVTLKVSDAEDIQGEYVEETYNEEDGSVKVAAHYQPLESFEVSNFVLSFTKANGTYDPAYYYPTSTSTNGKTTLRLYGGAKDENQQYTAGNTMTVTAPEGVLMSKLVFSDGSNGTAGAAHEATVGEVSNVTASGMTWTYDEGTNSVTFTMLSTCRFATLTVTTGTAEENGGNEETNGIFSSLDESDANGADGWEFDNVTLDENLTYVWSWKSYNSSYYLNASGYNKQAYASEAYAISPVIDMTNYKNCTVSFDHAAKFQTTLRDLCGLYVREEGAEGWEDELTIPTWPDAGSWTFANSGDISLSAYDGKKIQLAFLYGSTSEGSDTWEIKNFVVDGEATSGVQTVVADTTNAPVVYYNLQGQRVANPAQGLYIRVQGSKVEKVAIR